MIERYNPRFLDKEINRLSRCLPVTDLARDTLDRAAAIWAGRVLPIPDFPPVGVSPTLYEEFGGDAVRLAALTAPQDFPGETMLESCFCWLGRVWETAHHGQEPEPDDPPPHPGHRLSTGPERATAGPVVPWLKAAGVMSDHLRRRGRLYPALAAFRSAWKRSPLTAHTPPALSALILSLLQPFAPTLSTWLAQERGDALASPDDIAASFLPLRAWRIGVEKGGWQWEVFPADLFSRDPLGCLQTLPWVKKSFSRCAISIREELDGWRICIPRASRTNDNSSPS